MKDLTKSIRPLRIIFLLFLIVSTVLMLGTLGFYLIEGESLFDSFYMALITLTTVGYAETIPLSQSGRIFNAILLLSGFAVIFITLGVIDDLIFKLEMFNYFGIRKTKRMIKKISDHYIVCGLGRVGQGVIDELLNQGQPIIAVEKSESRAAFAQEKNIPTIVDDASLDTTLLNAGAKRAKGLVAAIGDDAQNVYVVLTAKGLNPALPVAARATNPEAHPKLNRAGAEVVFSPYKYVGHRLAQALISPHVLSFIDIAADMQGTDTDSDIRQFSVGHKSDLAGKALDVIQLPQRLEIMVLAISKSEGTMRLNPTGDTCIDAGDILVVMGKSDHLEQLESELQG